MEHTTGTRFVKKDLWGKEVWWYVKRNGASVPVVHWLEVQLKTPYWLLQRFWFKDIGVYYYWDNNIFTGWKNAKRGYFKYK